MTSLADAHTGYTYSVLLKSPTYRRWNGQKLAAFIDWATEQGIHDVEEIKPSVVARFLDHLRERINQRTGKPLSTYTLHGYAEVVKAWLNWCAADDIIPDKVPRRIAMPKVEIKVIETFSDEQIKRMFAATNHSETADQRMRDTAILALFLDTGVRADELRGLTLERAILTPTEAYVRVKGKGNKTREIGLGDRARQHLHRYITRYRHAKPDVEQVFVGRYGRPLSARGLDAIVIRLGKHAKVAGVRCSCHTFRHTFAVHYLANGGDIYMLSRILGHTSVKTTEGYLRAVTSRQVRSTQRTSILNAI